MYHIIPCQYSIRLIKKLRYLDNTSALDFSIIEDVIYWARNYHARQFRKSGEPFYTHLLEVAYLISEYNLKTDIIVTSILHDIVEDTEFKVGMILDKFRWRVAEMVDSLTRDRPDGTKLSVKEILNNAYGKEVFLIKVIDRLHNIQTLRSMHVNKVSEITIETLINFITSSMYIGIYIF